MLPVLKLSWSIDQPQVAFVYDRSTLQRMIRTLPLPVVVCHPTQLVVDQWQECIKRGLVAVAPLPQQLGDLVGRGAWQVRLSHRPTRAQRQNFRTKIPHSSRNQLDENKGITDLGLRQEIFPCSIREFVAGLRFSPEAENRDSCFVLSREGQTTGVVMTRFMAVTSWAAGGHLGTNLTNSQRDLMQTS